MTDLRVLILADDPLVRAGLARALETQPGLVVAGQDSAQADLVAACSLFHPDVVLWDAGWDLDIAASRSIAELVAAHNSALPPIVLLLPEGVDQVDLAATLRAAGAAGLISRMVAVPVVAAALAAATEGLAVFDRGFLPQRSEPSAAALQPPALPETLTPRESEVLQLVAEGLSNKQIAQRLMISEHTVKFHVNSLMGKLSAGSRTEAVVRATRLGLVLL